MSLPKNHLQISPPGTRVLELVDEQIRRLQALPWGQPVPAPRPLSFEAEVVHTMAKLEASIIDLTALIANPDRSPEVPIETIQEALAGDLAVRAAFREDLVADEGGYFVWMVFADASITRGSLRVSQ